MNLPRQTNDSIPTAVPILLETLSGVLFGALVGWFLISRFLLALAKVVDWLPQDRVLYAVIFAGLTGLNGFVSAWRKVRRAKKMRDVARALDMEYVASDSELARRVQQLFSTEGILTLRNIAQKQIGEARFLVAEMQYRTIGSKQRQASTQTIAYFECQGMHLPQFTLLPEGVLESWFSSIVGIEDIDFEDIDFEGCPEFSDHYLLRSSDSTAVRQIFAGEICRYFQDRPNFEVCASADQLVLFQRGQCRSASDLESFVEQATETLALFDAAAYQWQLSSAESPKKTPPQQQDPPVQPS